MKPLVILWVAILFAAASGTTVAQTPSAEELLAKIEAKVAAQNPYQALLNDPDPQRSLAAMEVMLESGDNKLIQMAVEFGLLSPNPEVQRTALHGVMASKPVLTLRLDGSQIETPNFKGSVLQWLNGSVTDQNIGFVPVGFGEWSQENSCYLLKAGNACGLTVNSEGNFLTLNDNSVSVQLMIGADGVLTGSGSLYNVSESVPMSIRLVD